MGVSRESLVRPMNGEDTPGKHRGLRPPWQPGQSGNPNGRPKGARSKLAELFWSDLYEKWKAKGAAAIDDMIADKPGDFVKVVASQMPKEFLVKAADLEDVSDDELGDIIATLRSIARSGNPEKAGNRTGKAARKGPDGGVTH